MSGATILLTFSRSLLSLICVSATALLVGCGYTGPIRATRDIRVGEKFYQNWEGSKVGNNDSLVMLSAYSARNIKAGQDIKPADVMAAVNVDTDWCQDVRFRSAKDPALKLHLLDRDGARIERAGKTEATGDWSLEQKEGNSFILLKLKGRAPVELYGTRSLEGELRMLNTPVPSGVPESVWIEDVDETKPQTPTNPSSTRKSGRKHKH